MFSRLPGSERGFRRSARPARRRSPWGLPVLLWAACLLPVALADSLPVARPPNVVVILLDDAGWRDAGFAGNDFIETPNIDALAARGARFRTAYATHPFCAPTRQSLISGQWPARTAWARREEIANPDAPRGAPPYAAAGAATWTALPPAFTSLPEALRAAGYATAHIGKWHYGEVGADVTPESEGFEHSFGGAQRVGAVGSFFSPYPGLPGGVAAPPGEYLTDRLTAEAIGFIRSHRERPFYLQLSHYAPHTPIQAPEPLVEKYRRKQRALGEGGLNPTYAAMIEVVDQGVGRILETLRELDLADDTVILFTSDNGGVAFFGSLPVTSMQPLRGEKGLSYEGGVRVPMMIHWPGVTSGREIAEPVNVIDFYPTILALAGVATPPGQPVDGVSLLPLLRGEAMPELQERPHFWYNVTSGLTSQGEPFQAVAAVRRGRWRLIKPFLQPLQLYDLSVDPGERHNLAGTEPGVAAALESALDAWLQDTGVALPTPNPFHDPSYVIPRQVKALPDAATLQRSWQPGARGSRWRAVQHVRTSRVKGALRMRADGLYPMVRSPELAGLPAARYAVQLELRVATAGRVRLHWEGDGESGDIEFFPRRDGRAHTLTGVFEARKPLRALSLAAPTHLGESGWYDPARDPDWIDLVSVRLFSLPAGRG